MTQERLDELFAIWQQRPLIGAPLIEAPGAAELFAEVFRLRTSLGSILGPEIEAERARQDAQWGGPGHDDGHTEEDWCAFIDKQLTWADRAADDAFTDPTLWKEYEERLIKIAALAVAAVKAKRRNLTPHGCIDTKPGWTA